MPHHIHQGKVREALTPRREPYWGAQIEPGRFIGYRKIGFQRGSWIARARDPDTSKQQYQALRSAIDYETARKAAQEWFASLDAGVRTMRRFTVADACREYIEELKRANRDKTAKDAEWRFKRGGISEGGAFGAIELAKLRTPAIKKWRDELMAESEATPRGGKRRQMTKAGANRMMTALRRALNLAVENRRVSAAVAQEWRLVKQYKAADGRREIFLDIEQRRALLAAAAGSVRDLIEAALLTGARPGELAAATRSAFDGRTQTLKLTGKTGPRTVPLTGAALTFFERVSKSKLPGATLLPRDDGKPWQRAEWTESVRAAAEAAAVKDTGEKETKLPPGVCLYSCRHTHITQSLMDGLTTLDVARLTGTSLAMIEKHYGQFVQGAVRERLAKVVML